MKALTLDRVVFALFAALFAGLLWSGLDTLQQLEQLRDAQPTSATYQELAP